MADPKALSPPVREALPGRLLGAVELPAVPESVSIARQFVKDRLGGDHPALDDVTLVVSELVTNSLRHSDSRKGGSVTLALAYAFDRIHVDVVDAGSAGFPRVRAAEGEPRGDLPDGGRGLLLVADRSLAWGFHDDATGRTVWCQIGYRRADGTTDPVCGAAPV